MSKKQTKKTDKIVLVTKDSDLLNKAKRAFNGKVKLVVSDDWKSALEESNGTSLMVVDLMATLRKPKKIAGYEEFALAKMNHKSASKTKLIVIYPPEDYRLDGMVGWPNFVFAMLRKPLTLQDLKKITNWIQIGN